MKKIRRHGEMRILLVFLLILTTIFTYGEVFYPHSPEIPSGASLEAPSLAHILGTDNLGIDIFAQISRGYFSCMFMGIMSAVLDFLPEGF